MRDREDWYGYIYPKNLEVMSRPKILVPSIATRSEYCLDKAGELHFVGSGGGGGGGYAIVPAGDVDLAYLCGVLNSRCLDAFLKQITTPFHSGWYAYSKHYIGQLPIKLPETPAERRDADRISQIVQRIIEVKTRLQTGGLGDHERERLERQVEAHEQRIDELVYALYALGPEDIKNVEGATR
jgi:hypothetical protein